MPPGIQAYPLASPQIDELAGKQCTRIVRKADRHGPPVHRHERGALWATWRRSLGKVTPIDANFDHFRRRPAKRCEQPLETSQGERKMVRLGRYDPDDLALEAASWRGLILQAVAGTR